MTQYISEITVVSSKGQVVLPKAIRAKLNLNAGSKLMVFSDGDNILLKPITQPDIAEFREMIDTAQQWADEVGMKESDIREAITLVRRKKNTVK
jgi:antitoxin PrlF